LAGIFPAKPQHQDNDLSSHWVSTGAESRMNLLLFVFDPIPAAPMAPALGPAVRTAVVGARAATRPSSPRAPSPLCRVQAVPSVAASGFVHSGLPSLQSDSIDRDGRAYKHAAIFASATAASRRQPIGQQRATRRPQGRARRRCRGPWRPVCAPTRASSDGGGPLKGGGLARWALFPTRRIRRPTVRAAGAPDHRRGGRASQRRAGRYPSAAQTRARRPPARPQEPKKHVVPWHPLIPSLRAYALSARRAPARGRRPAAKGGRAGAARAVARGAAAAMAHGRRGPRRLDAPQKGDDEAPPPRVGPAGRDDGRPRRAPRRLWRTRRPHGRCRCPPCHPSNGHASRRGGPADSTWHVPAPALRSLKGVGAQSPFWLMWAAHFFVEPVRMGDTVWFSPQMFVQ